MPGEDFNFIVGLDFSTKAFQQARKNLQRLFQNVDIDLNISPSTIKKIAAKSGTATPTSSEAFASGFKRASKQLEEAQKNLADAMDREADNSAVITVLHSRLETLMADEIDELRKRINASAGLNAEVKKLELEIAQLTPIVNNLQAGMIAARNQVLLAGTGLARIKPNALSTAITNLEGVAAQFATKFRQAIGTVSDVPIGRIFQDIVGQLEGRIKAAASSFERLGFNAKDQAGLIDFAVASFREKIGEAGNAFVSQSLARGINHLTKVFESLGSSKIDTSMAAFTKGILAGDTEVRRFKEALSRTSARVGGIALEGFTGGLSGAFSEFTSLRDSLKKSVRILDEAVVTASPLANELEGQREAIRKEIAATGQITEKQKKFLTVITRATEALKTMSRPSEALSERVATLAAQFAAGPAQALVQLVSTNDKLKKFVTSIDDAKRLFDRFGADFGRVADEILAKAQADGNGLIGDDAEEFRERLIKELNASIQAEIDSNKAIVAANNKWLKGLQDRSRERTDKWSAVLADEQRAAAAEIREKAKDFKGAGAEAVRTGASMRNFQTKLNEVIRQIIDSIGADRFRNLAFAEGGDNLTKVLNDIARQYEREFLGALEKKTAARMKEEDRLLQIEKKVGAAREKVAKKQEELVRAIDKQIRDTRTAEGKKASPTFGNIGQIASFGKGLDAQEQERFINALKRQGSAIKDINTQLTSHNGNLAKSSAIVDKLTASMTTGQKAAFQFGFAAASAAERLLAWASPASFLFQAISLLRNAASDIIKLDSELRRAVVFSPKTIATQIVQIQKLGGGFEYLASVNDDFADKVIKSSTATERQEARNRALIDSLDNVINRSKETGIAVDELTKGIVASARVGREPFQGPDPTPFLQAVEAFKVLEGSAADTDRVISLLNSALNQFGLNGEHAVSVLAQVEKTAAASALEGQDLLDVLVRTGGGFELLTNASIPESLAIIKSSVDANIPSISKLSTALRQFFILAVENQDKIKQFSGIELVEAGQIKGPLEFVEVLQKLNKLAPAVREEFLSLFSERDTGATILALATQSDKLSEALRDLANPAEAARIAFESTGEFFENAGFKSQSLENNINRLKASVAGLVNESGIEGFASSFIKAGAGIADFLGSAVSKVNEFANVFKILAAVAAPTIFRIVQGFREGFLQQQNFTKVKNDIITSLGRELGAVEAVNRAEKEHLISGSKARELRNQTLNIAARLIPLDAKIAQQEAELVVLRKQENLEAGKLEKAEQKLLTMQEQRNILAKQELAIREKARKVALEDGDAQLRQGFNKLKGIAAGAGAVVGLEFGPKIVAGMIDSISADKKLGSQIGNSLQAAIGGALTGSVFGGIPGAVAGAAIAGIATFVQQRKEAALAAKEEAKVDAERLRASNLAIQEATKREKERADAKLIVSRAEEQLARTTFEIQRLELEINKIGAERAQQLGLFERRAELETRLVKEQLQLRIREQEKIQQNISFEQNLVGIRERALTVEKAINLVRQAQVGIAQSVGDERAQLNIEFTFDKAQLANRVQEIEQAITATRTRIAILGAEADKGNAQELRRQAGELEKLENEKKRAKLEEIGLELAALKKQEELEKKLTDNRIQAFKDAGQQLAAGFKNVVNQQFEVVRAIAAQGEIFKSIAETITDSAQEELSRPGSGLNDEQQLARRLQIQRDALRQQLNRIEKIFSDQTKALTSSKPLVEIQQQTDSFIQAVRAANSGLGQFSTKVTDTARVQQTNLDVQRARIDADIEASKARINAEKEFVGKVIDVRRQEIAIIRQEIDAHQKRIDKDAEIGQKLLTAPDEFVKQLRSINFAQSLFQGLPAGLAAVEELEKRIRKLQGGEQGGTAALNKVLDGLRAAVDLNVNVLKGLSPEETLSVFSRLLFQDSATIKDGVNKQNAMVNEIQNVNNSIVQGFERQVQLITEEMKLQGQVNKISDEQKKIIERQFESLEKITKDSIQLSKETSDSFKNFASKVASISLPDFGQLTTAGDQQIVSKMEEVRSILETMSRVDISNAKATDAALRSELEALKKGRLTGDSERLFKEGTPENLRTLKTREQEFRDRISGLRQEAQKFLDQGDTANADLSIARTEPIIAQLEANLKQQAEIETRYRKEFIQSRIRLLDEQVFEFEQIFNRASKTISDNATRIFKPIEAGLPIQSGIQSGVVAALPAATISPSLPVNPKIPEDKPQTIQERLAARDLAVSRGQQVDARAINRELIDAFTAKMNGAISTMDESLQRFARAAINNISTTEPSVEVLKAELDRAAKFIETLRGINEAEAERQKTRVRESVQQTSSAIIDAFNQATDGMIARLDTALSRSISVDVPGVNVQLDAKISQKLDGDEFAAQLVAALQGTGLEDRVDVIQGVVAKLVKTALDRGEVFDGADVIDFGGGRLS